MYINKQMSNMKAGDEIYNVNKYTDEELYSILDLINPTDRELEARLYHLINKYKNMETDSGDRLASFFNNIYARFFELIEDQDENMATANTIDDVAIEKMEGGDNVTLTTQMNYTRDPLNMNPILKQTITRIISIDSLYRNNKKTTLSTNFSFNLSDSLRHVVALRLNSVQIPKTWYTINKNYGANFFYLKGNSPGIADGNHDYKIAIKAGNYTASELITTLSTSMQKMKLTYTDASFGTSDITYNTYTGRSTITLDFTKIYNESSFSLYFPTFSWHSDDSSIGTFATIPSILGYNNTTYTPNSVFSIRSSQLLDEEEFWLDTSNNYFQIIQYPGSIKSSYTDAYDDVSYQTITIVSSLVVDASYSRVDIVADFNAQLGVAVELSTAKIEVLTVSDASAEYFGTSYYKFTLPLNPYIATIVKNSKTVAIFPNDKSIWLGEDSCFKIANQRNELSDIKGESETNVSDFNVESNVYIYLKCQRTGYVETDDFSKNTVTIKITPSKYSLDKYISQINNDISNANIDNIFTLDTNKLLNTTSFAINNNSNYKTRTRYYLHKAFGTSAYSIDTSGIGANGKYYFGNTLNMSFVNYDFSANTSEMTGKVLSQSTYYLPFYTTFFVVKPNTNLNLGNKNAENYTVIFTQDVFNDISDNLASDYPFFTSTEIEIIINYTIQYWKDPILNIYPFSETVFSISDTGTGTYKNVSLSMNVNVELSTRDFIVYYVDPNDSWYSYLKLDTSYNLETYIYEDSKFNFSYADIIGPTKINSNQITIASSNNTFYIKATGDGVYDSTGANTKTITLTNGTYTVDNLIVEINSQFDTVIPGSKINKDVSGNISLRLNVNKVFNAKDYRIVFYDPYSFVKCTTGASSVRNTSWDSTVGWVIGFHTLTEYPLGLKYINVDENDETIQYYSDTASEYSYDSTSDIATIIGDTNVNVNMYNYFMIVLDDYAQNHLNDGMVTITPAESNITPSSYANRATFRCDPVTGEQIFYGTTNESGNKNTEKEVYAANQKLNARKATAKIYSSGPFIQDIFALIPLNVSGLANGSIFTDTGSALNKQERVYFGPVNISRMRLKLINDRGEVVDLNGSDWSISFQCDQLYQQKSVK